MPAMVTVVVTTLPRDDRSGRGIREVLRVTAALAIDGEDAVRELPAQQLALLTLQLAVRRA